MNFDPQTYEELIRMKRCVELTKYYELTEEELEEIYRFLEQNPEASVKGGRQNLALIRGPGYPECPGNHSKLHR